MRIDICHVSNLNLNPTISKKSGSPTLFHFGIQLRYWTKTVLVLPLSESSSGVNIGNYGASLKLFVKIAEYYDNENHLVGCGGIRQVGRIRFLPILINNAHHPLRSNTSKRIQIINFFHDRILGAALPRPFLLP